MSKTRLYFLRIGIACSVALAMYLLFQLLLALLIVKGTLTENRTIVMQIAAGGMSALLGGYLAMNTTKWLPAAGLTGVGIALITAVLGFAIYDGILLNAETLLRVTTMLVGGMIPSLLTGKKKRKRAGKSAGRRVQKI